MNFTKSVALALTLSASTAFAGAVETPIIPTVTLAAPAAATDWSGLYVGGTYSTNSGTGDYIGPVFGSPGNPLSGPLYGAYAGYNVQRGALVFGGELAFQSGTIAFDWPIAPNTAEASNIFDTKLRAGFAMDRVMAYGVAGYSSGNYEETSGGPVTASASMAGFSYGAGVEMKVGRNMVVGVEYLKRELSGDYNAPVPGSVDLHLDTVQLRVGWQF